MQKLTLVLINLIVKIFRLIPFRLVYLFSDFLFFIFYYLIRYRKGVITKSLSNSFPGKTNKEIGFITRSYYRYFCDLLLEVIKGLSLSKPVFQRRFVYKNPEIFAPYFKENRSAILLGSHYGNWEWGRLSFPFSVSHQAVGIYKPVKNTLI